MDDITLKCVEQGCGKDFIFRVKDQLFFQEQGFTPPKRCVDCRAKKKANHPKDQQPRVERQYQPRYVQPAIPQPEMTMHDWNDSPSVPRRRQFKDRDRRY